MTGRVGRALRELAVELGFSLALVLAAEAVHRGTGWARLWCLFGALAVGHGGRAVLARRRRLRDAQRSTSLASGHVP
ncbi:hypothetical protein AB1207_05170 [Kineococcus endophyticus]|uniref:MYXO-CTERM domain-containing protein n=1 Tax=Kineococcus endophyticus TaxID=1181883 RepID=A0ABV3P3Z4_9ACTN